MIHPESSVILLYMNPNGKYLYSRTFGLGGMNTYAALLNVGFVSFILILRHGAAKIIILNIVSSEVI